MSSQPRYLTKSRFKTALECPTKLFYTGKKNYANQKLSDPFLMALANGGFQVGELAKCYFPGGVEVSTLDYDESVRQTEALLAQENVTIFEGAFRHNNLFIRADIVVKKGDAIELIEVKAKSCDFADESECWDKRKGKTYGNLKSDWEPYIADVAFQKYVIENATNFNVTAHLMLADKNAVCGTDGLNQKFRIVTRDGRKGVVVSPDLCDADLAVPILRKICVDESCNKIYAAVEAEVQLDANPNYGEQSAYALFVNQLADRYARDEKIVVAPSSICKDCEFRHADGDTDLVSGFRECWAAAFKWQDPDFDDASVLDLWTFARKDDLIAAGKLKMSQITPDDIAPKSKPKGDPKPGFSTTERQWAQIRKAADRDNTPHIYADELKREMDSWTFPLHFIDFETASPVIPFKRGRRPYEGLAFQFSHHTVDADGRVEHRGEYLNAVPGAFPSYDLVRELKTQLGSDSGSIFRYHSHENSQLCSIREQMLRDPNAPADRDDLIDFIETIAKPRSQKDHPEDDWTAGPRNMVDLFDMVKRYYYHPATRGSISLKYVLPAVLSSSDFLKEKYAAPIYGGDGIPSLNFKDQRWVVFEDHAATSAIPNPNSQIPNPKDPYKLLPPLFTDESERDYEIILEQDRITDGGAAMTAYGKLQFQEMSDHERQAVESALLKYCELDTLAMVMIYEAWKAEV